MAAIAACAVSDCEVTPSMIVAMSGAAGTMPCPVTVILPAASAAMAIMPIGAATRHAIAKARSRCLVRPIILVILSTVDPSFASQTQHATRSLGQVLSFGEFLL